MREFSPLYLSEFCFELNLLVRAGIPISDSLQILRDDDNCRVSNELHDSLYETAEKEVPLSEILETSGRFPQYMLSTIRLGERTGKLDEALFALYIYYERRAKLTESIRSAVLYPTMLLIMMSAVFIVLVTLVLPIFNEVFAQMGMQMSGLALTLMNFGKWLSSAAAGILAVIIVILIIAVLIYLAPATRRAMSKQIERTFGDKGVFGRVLSFRFAMAMSMAVSSGLDLEQAVSLAGDVCGNSFVMKKKLSLCREYLEQGNALDNCLSKSKIFTKYDSRLLAIGARSGNTDGVMSEIARRGEERVLGELDEKLNKIEPTLVIIISLMVGLILFSVMLPLMGIMSAIG